MTCYYCYGVRKNLFEHEIEYAKECLTELQAYLEKDIEEKESYIAEFEEEKQKFESMSEEEKTAYIEERAQEQVSHSVNEHNRKVNLYTGVNSAASDDTREAIEVVHDMTEKQLYKRDEIAQSLQVIIAGFGMGATVGGLTAGIMEQSLAAGGQAALVGGALIATLGGLMVAVDRAVGPIKMRKIIKKYPEAKETLKELGIYDIVMDYIGEEHGFEWDSDNEEFIDEETKERRSI